MKVADFTQWAKKAQAILKATGMPAEHIYLVGYNDPRSIPSLVFVSSAYNRLDIYHRAQLASFIQNGPLKFDFHILGTEQVQTSNNIGRDRLYRAIKLYGKKPLLINGLEFASKHDAELKSSALNELAF